MTVLDLGCGVGYGTKILSDAAKHVTGIERPDVVEYARREWQPQCSGDVVFEQADLSTGAPAHHADAAVAFEVIEHLRDPRPMLSGLQARWLYASVPNEDVFPYQDYKHHWRHYTRAQFEALLAECGWQVVEWHGQVDAEVERDVDGATLIAICRRSLGYRHPTGAIPETVMLCGLGPSKYELTELMVQHDFSAPWQELWTVNKGIGIFPQADVAFVMDDVYDYAEKHPAYGRELRVFRGKIIGQSTIRNDGSIEFREYPLAEIIKFWGGTAANWLHTISIGYVLAYAGMIGVRRLMLAGIDCSWPGRPDLSEAGNAVVCYWCGRLEGAGVEVVINSESTLNQTNRRGEYGYRRFYGYLRQPRG